MDKDEQASKSNELSASTARTNNACDSINNGEGEVGEVLQEIEEDGIGINDVICGRCKVALNNIGNRRFRILVSLHVAKYVSMEATRKTKSDLIWTIIHSIQSCGGRFLQQRDVKNGKKSLQELTNKQAYEKVGHALRDMAASKQIEDTSWERYSNASSVSSNLGESNNSSSNPIVSIITAHVPQVPRYSQVPDRIDTSGDSNTENNNIINNDKYNCPTSISFLSSTSAVQSAVQNTMQNALQNAPQQQESILPTSYTYAHDMRQSLVLQSNIPDNTSMSVTDVMLDSKEFEKDSMSQKLCTRSTSIGTITLPHVGVGSCSSSDVQLKNDHDDTIMFHPSMFLDDDLLYDKTWDDGNQDSANNMDSYMSHDQQQQM